MGLERLDCLSILTTVFCIEGLLSGFAQPMCVLWSSKWEFWQKPSCGWPFWSRRQPSRKNLLFLSPAYLSWVRLGQSLLACCLCCCHVASLSVLLRRQPDYSPSALYQVCRSSAFKILKLTFFHEAPFSNQAFKTPLFSFGIEQPWFTNLTSQKWRPCKPEKGSSDHQEPAWAHSEPGRILS